MSSPKKQFSARAFILPSLIIFILLSAFAPMAQEPEGSLLDRIAEIALSFLSLGGVAAIVTAVTAFAQSQGWVNEEGAGRLRAGLNLAGFIILVLFGVFRPDLSLDYLDGRAHVIASTLVFILGLISQVLLPAPMLRAAYQARVPVLKEAGERVEMRAHYVRPSEPGENWASDEFPPKRKQ